MARSITHEYPTISIGAGNTGTIAARIPKTAIAMSVVLESNNVPAANVTITSQLRRNIINAVNADVQSIINEADPSSGAQGNITLYGEDFFELTLTSNASSPLKLTRNS